MRYPGFELSVLTFLWSISLTGVVLAVDREGNPLDPSGEVCDPELLSSPTNSLSVEKLLKRLHIDKAALSAYQLKTFASTHPQAEKILSHIIKNISRDQQRLFIEVITRYGDSLSPDIVRLILNYHRKRASQNEQRLYFYILDQALYVKAAQGEIKTYADAVKRVIRQLILSNPEESTELSQRLDLKVNQSRPLSMSESAINTEKDIDDLLHRFDIQSHTLEPTAFVSPLAVLFRSFLRNEEHRQHASQAIDNFYLHTALEGHPDIMTYMIYHFLLNDMGPAHIDFIVKGPMDHSRFLNISGLMFEALRSQPQYAYNKVYQAVLLMERERGMQ